jgi:hypothetical protein
MFYNVFTQITGVPIPMHYKSRREWVALFKKAGFRLKKGVVLEPDNPFTPVYYILEKI